jgi:hypothetical protein
VFLERTRLAQRADLPLVVPEMDYVITGQGVGKAGPGCWSGCSSHTGRAAAWGSRSSEPGPRPVRATPPWSWREPHGPRRTTWRPSAAVPARTGPKSQALAPRAIGVRAMYNLVRRYFEQLPRALRPVAEGSSLQRCLYTPHSLRATTATLLLKAGVDLLEVQELLGHRHVTTTQIYDKRVRQTRDGASHKVPF